MLRALSRRILTPYGQHHGHVLPYGCVATTAVYVQCNRLARRLQASSPFERLVKIMCVSPNEPQASRLGAFQMYVYTISTRRTSESDPFFSFANVETNQRKTAVVRHRARA